MHIYLSAYFVASTLSKIHVALEHNNFEPCMSFYRPKSAVSKTDRNMNQI